jgi:hypothetical protein
MIIIKGLPLEITESDLDELFSKYGKIQKYEIQVSVQLDKNEELAVEELNKNWTDKDLTKEFPVSFTGAEFVSDIADIQSSGHKIKRPQSSGNKIRRLQSSGNNIIQPKPPGGCKGTSEECEDSKPKRSKQK